MTAMDIEQLSERLSHHETAYQQRYEKLHHEITKGHEMSTQPINLIEGGGAGIGAGMGGAGLGIGALLGLALGRGGLLGNDGFRHGGGEPCATVTQLADSTSSITDTIQNSNLQTGQGDIKQAIFQAEGNLQLAGAENTSAIRSHMGQVENTITAGQLNLANGINGVNVNVLTSAAATREAVAQYGTANLTATKDAQYAITTAIRDDGDKTRALIVNQDMANLQRQLAVAESALLDRNAALRARETEINISNVNTATAQQAQAQTMQQNQWQAIIQLAEGVRNLAGDIQAVRQTQSQVVFGNNIGSGQAANATNNSVR